MDNKVKAIYVSRGSRFVNIGYEINGEILIFQINFILNANNWGAIVVDPDGNTTTKLVKLGTEIKEMVLKVDDFEITIDIFDNDEIGLFEIYYH